MAEKAPPKKILKFTPNPSAGSSAGGGGGGGDGAAAPALKAEKASPEKKRVRFKLPDNPSAGGGGGSGGGGGDGDSAAAPALKAGKATPEKKRVRFKLPDNSSAGSSAGGGVGGGGGAAALQQEPSSSRPPSLPPPDDDDDDDDDFDFEGFEEQELDRLERESGHFSLFMSDPATLYIDSKDPQKPPEYIGRQSCEPLITQEFFLLRRNWQQLLDGKNTYLRPPKNNRVTKHSFDDRAFVTPAPLEKAVRCQEPLSDFVREAAENSIVQQKFKILNEHYVCIRQMRIDGSSFYRAFLYSYLENLGKMQGSQAEVTRLMECVARSRENFCCLHWDRAYFSNPEAFFSTVVSEFENLVHSVANGLNADELYKRSLQEITSSRKVHIRTHHADYGPAFREQITALKFCVASVRPFDAEGDMLQMSALSNALGIPLHVALMDNDGIAKVSCLDFLPQPESRVSRTSTKSYDLSSATDKHPEQGRDDSNSTMPAGNLFSSDHMPLVILLGRMGHCDILYRK